MAYSLGGLWLSPAVPEGPLVMALPYRWCVVPKGRTVSQDRRPVSPEGRCRMASEGRRWVAWEDRCPEDRRWVAREDRTSVSPEDRRYVAAQGRRHIVLGKAVIGRPRTGRR